MNFLRQATQLMSSRPYADYVYRNKDDSVRFKVFRTEGGWWDVDFFSKTPEGYDVETFSTEAGDVFYTKKEALDYINEHYGKVIRLGLVSDILQGWKVR